MATLTLGEIQHEVGSWGDETFPHSTPDSVLAHLKREVQELLDADPANRQAECADVVMLLMHIAHKEGWSLERAVLMKLAINQSRSWGEPDEQGVVEHIREEAR